MATITTTSAIKSKVEITDKLDLSSYPNCIHCGLAPRVFEITWGSRKNTGQIVECCEAGSGWLENWKRCNSPALSDPLIEYRNRVNQITSAA